MTKASAPALSGEKCCRRQVLVAKCCGQATDLLSNGLRVASGLMGRTSLLRGGEIKYSSNDEAKGWSMNLV